MEILHNIYYKSLEDNERNLRFWEDYLNRLKELNLNVYSDNLKVPVLVPVGSRILFRGEIKHTNEVTVSLGADYFAKCSTKQAEILRQHRIKDAESKLNTYRKEREYIESQLNFNNTNILQDAGQNIVETFTEDEDKLWREKHRDNVRKYKQNAKKTDNKETGFTDEELWNRLEELELKEELENEFEDLNSKDQSELPPNIEFVLEDEQENIDKTKDVKNTENEKVKELSYKKVSFSETNEVPNSSKLDLLQKILEKQTELEVKLHEIKSKDRAASKSEQDLLEKLDEMEELEELEEEIDRLDDIIECDDIENVEEEVILSEGNVKSRSVSFAGEDSDDDTVEITFKHSDTEPDKQPYTPEKGINKPSDIYEACHNQFTVTKSILKRTKYIDKVEIPDDLQSSSEQQMMQSSDELNEDVRTIVVKDIVENVHTTDNKQESFARPTSLFKMRRQQRK